MNPMNTEFTTLEFDGDIALIGLNRPDKRNAISDRFVQGIHDVVRQAERQAKVGIIFGHGEHFSAGLDLSEIGHKTYHENVLGSRAWHLAFDAIQRGAIPFVSALHGAVVGGGLELAASTHVRVADETAFFALPEGQRGIFVGGGGSVRIARLMSAARMADLMLTGRVLSATEGERANLVQYLVPPGQALAKAKELARRMAANAPMSNYAVINVLPRIQDMAQDDGLFVESMTAAFTATSPEARERLDAFLAKRAAPLRQPEGA